MPESRYFVLPDCTTFYPTQAAAVEAQAKVGGKVMEMWSQNCATTVRLARWDAAQLRQRLKAVSDE